MGQCIACRQPIEDAKWTKVFVTHRNQVHEATPYCTSCIREHYERSPIGAYGLNRNGHYPPTYKWDRPCEYCSRFAAVSRGGTYACFRHKERLPPARKEARA